MNSETKKVIFQKGEFHGFEFIVESFFDDRPIDEFLTLPACYVESDSIEYWAETYQWTGDTDEQGRFVYKHFGSKFVRSQKKYRTDQEMAKLPEVSL